MSSRRGQMSAARPGQHYDVLMNTRKRARDRSDACADIRARHCMAQGTRPRVAFGRRRRKKLSRGSARPDARPANAARQSRPRYRPAHRWRPADHWCERTAPPHRPCTPSRRRRSADGRTGRRRRQRRAADAPLRRRHPVRPVPARSWPWRSARGPASGGGWGSSALSSSFTGNRHCRGYWRAAALALPVRVWGLSCRGRI